MAKSSVESTTSVVIGLTEKVPIQVLHVDDEASLLKVAEQILEIQGAFQVETALSVEEAMQKMRQKEFDAVVSDYMMPGKDGLQFLKELREESSKIPFIIFTGKGREEVAIKALNLGADQYVNKSGPPSTVYSELAHAIRHSVERRRAEELLKESEEEHRALLDMANVLIQSVNAEGRFVYVNKEWKRKLGFTDKDLKKITLMDIIRKDHRKHCMDIFKQVKDGKSVYNVETVLVAKDGKELMVSGNAMPRLKKGKFVSTVGFFTDNTKRKKTEDERRTLLRDYSERIKELRCLYKISKLVEKRNVSLEDILQETANLLPPAWQYPDITCSRIVYENREFRTENFRQTCWKQQAALKIRGKKAGAVEVYYLEERPTIDEGPFLKEERDLLDAVVEQLGRIIERKMTEERVRESEEKYRSLFENSKDVTITLDLKGTMTSINKAAAKYGFKKDETLGRNMLKFVPKRYWPKLLKELAQISRGKTVDGTIEIITPKGKKVAEYRSNPIVIGNKVVGVQTILKDVTERRTMEEALRESEKRHRTLLETANVMVQSVNADGRFVYVNKEWKRKLGFTDKDLKKITLMDIIRKDHRKHCMDIFKQVKDGKSARDIEAVFVTKNGREMMVSGNARPILKDGEFVSTVGFFADVTERKKAEEELKRSEKRLEILFEFAPDAYYLNDLKGNFVDGNKAAEELTGYDRSELIGKNFLKLKLLPRKQLTKAAKLLVKNVLGKRTGPDEFILNRKDDTQVPVEIRTIPVKIKGQTLVLGIARDISERKRAETALKTINEKLRVVGSLTRHDIRNKLTAVTGNVYLAKQKLTRDHEALKYLEEVKLAASQIERIFDFARTYEKLGSEELAFMDVEKSVRYAASLVSDLHSVQIVNGCRGLMVLADSLLRQLFYNLIHNSLKHGERVSQIRVYYEETGEDQLRLVYEDDGVGISKVEKEKIFEEGYGKGTGYGLYLIRKMCEVYGWSIRETGKQGKGVQFTITIPKLGENGKTLYKFH